MAEAPSGLVVVPRFLTKAEEWHVLALLGDAPREPGDERNRVLRYGAGVEASGYSSGVVQREIPEPIARIDRWLLHQGYIEQASDAITVGEYLPGQGLSFHADGEPAGPVVTIIALAGAAQLAFRRWDTHETYEMTFERQMLVQLTGAVRYNPWQHAILPVTERRVSIVFRRALP